MGKGVYKRKRSMKTGKFPRTESWRKNLSEKLRGEKSHLWKGGITSENQRLRMSLEMKLWRRAVFERDNYTCIWCGDSRGGNLQADHIKPFAYFPELRFAIDNGRTLCVPCHKSTSTYGRKEIATKASHSRKKIKPYIDAMLRRKVV